MNPNLARLQPYPFEKLRLLFKDIAPDPRYAAINLGIGEPKHPTPEFIRQAHRLRRRRRRTDPRGSALSHLPRQRLGVAGAGGRHRGLGRRNTCGGKPPADGKYSLYCAIIVKRVDAKTRAKTSINELLRGD